MEFLKLLFNRSKSFYALLGLLSLMNAALNTGLLLFINHTITGQPIPIVPEYAWVAYGGLILVSILSNRLFQTYMIRLTNDILFEFELKVLDKLRHATYEVFEKLGKEKVFTALGDTRVVGSFPEVFLNALKAVIIAVCCFAYLFWVFPPGGFCILLMMLALLLFYMARNARIEKDLNRLRDMRNDYFKYLNDFLHGFREIKMSITRSTAIYTKFLRRNRDDSKAITVSTSIQYMNNELVGGYSWYVVVGTIIFVLPAVFHLETRQTSAFLVTVLYLMGPVAVLITLVPTYTNVKIAVTRLNEFNYLTSLQESTEQGQATRLIPKGPVDRLRFENVTYEYFDDEKQKTFKLGPISLAIEGGSIVFLTGGNGSGKSTFVNLLTGLYRPVSGTIYFNDLAITNENYVQYRDKVSAVFTNNYLLGENYDGYDFDKRKQDLSAYLAMMRLTDVVRFNKPGEMIDSRLSKGQQKRLALVYALLESNPVLVLDEWAAEQDPQFRVYFYKHILPDLKAQGKTIIAVTHDDDYYACCDRLIKFNFGTVVSDQPSRNFPEAVATS